MATFGMIMSFLFGYINLLSSGLGRSIDGQKEEEEEFDQKCSIQLYEGQSFQVIMTVDVQAFLCPNIQSRFHKVTGARFFKKFSSS